PDKSLSPAGSVTKTAKDELLLFRKVTMTVKSFRVLFVTFRSSYRTKVVSPAGSVTKTAKDEFTFISKSHDDHRGRQNASSMPSHRVDAASESNDNTIFQENGFDISVVSVSPGCDELRLTVETTRVGYSGSICRKRGGPLNHNSFSRSAPGRRPRDAASAGFCFDEIWCPAGVGRQLVDRRAAISHEGGPFSMAWHSASANTFFGVSPEVNRGTAIVCNFNIMMDKLG
ncbi:unnamed protein product, partial [Trichogramma brassicae]